MTEHEELLGADFFEHDIRHPGVGVSRAISVLKHYDDGIDCTIAPDTINKGYINCRWIINKYSLHYYLIKANHTFFIVEEDMIFYRIFSLIRHVYVILGHDYFLETYYGTTQESKLDVLAFENEKDTKSWENNRLEMKNTIA